jgi:microcystin-dependent protein
MSTPYLAEIRVFSFDYAPSGWALCNGQLLPINQNQALFSLLGTTYGGNGTTTFSLPNLQGKCAICSSSNYLLGATGGEAAHTLVTSEMPAHTHNQAASSATGTETSPVNNYPAAVSSNPYLGSAATALTTVGSGSTSVGSGESHQNLSPYLVLNFCIALTGIYPSRS